MRLYIYSKCSTCVKAVQFLKNNKILFTQKEITETPPILQELEMMLLFQKNNLKKLFNSSGNLYRELQLGEKLCKMPLKDALSFLTQHGMLVKRPFLLENDFGLLGFKEVEWAKTLLHQRK